MNDHRSGGVIMTKYGPPNNNTSRLGPHYETACDLARGFCCGNCDRDQAHEWRCDEDGCCSLRDGIYEEMKAAVNRAATVPSEQDIATAIYVALSGCGALAPEIDDPTRECRVAARAVRAIMQHCSPVNRPVSDGDA